MQQNELEYSDDGISFHSTSDTSDCSFVSCSSSNLRPSLGSRVVKVFANHTKNLNSFPINVQNIPCDFT